VLKDRCDLEFGVRGCSCSDHDERVKDAKSPAKRFGFNHRIWESVDLGFLLLEELVLLILFVE